MTAGGVITAREVEKGGKVVATEEVALGEGGSVVVAGGVVEVWCDAYVC